MTRETFYRIWFTIMFLAVMFLASCQAVSAQPPAEGAMGTYPVPAVVGMTQQLPKVEEEVEVKGKMPKRPPIVSIDVMPKVAIPNPLSRTTFRVRFRIEEDDRNERYSYSADCGGNAKASQRKIDRVSYTLFEDMTVVRNCLFVACVHRLQDKKVVTFCATAEVQTLEQPP